MIAAGAGRRGTAEEKGRLPAAGGPHSGWPMHEVGTRRHQGAVGMHVATGERNRASSVLTQWRLSEYSPVASPRTDKPSASNQHCASFPASRPCWSWGCQQSQAAAWSRSGQGALFERNMGELADGANYEDCGGFQYTYFMDPRRWRMEILFSL